MSINYYPNETAKKLMHVIEKQQLPDVLYSVFGTYNLSGGNLSAGIWCPKGWEVRRVSLHFGSASPKNYSISVVRGVGISSGKNDRLWVKVDTVAAQQVLIAQGFYTGTTLAAAIATALNAEDFTSSAEPFSASYDSDTGLFSISPNSGNAKLFITNTTTPVRRNSTAANLIGFTSDTVSAATLTSDTAVMGLGSKLVYLSGVESTSLDVMSTEIVAMTIDNQLLIEASYTGVTDESSSSVSDPDLDTVTYEVVYKVLDA